MRHVLAFIPLALLVSACGGSLTDSKAGGQARVIVADIDSAMNPYHEYFYAGSPIYQNSVPSSVTPEVLAEVGVPPENVITLTRTGNIVRDKKTDEAIWAGIRRGKPYWFKGTNLIGVSFSGKPYLMPSVDPEKNPHGVGTSASVLTANPDAIILFVETWDSLANDDSHNYAFLHPAVDIITTSYGVSIPNTGFPLPEVTTFLATFDSVVRMGKMHFSSGGNGSGSTPHRAGAGPWWSIGVSGIEEYSSDGDQQGVSGNFPDFVSDFTQDLPYCQDCERGIDTGVPGTSFSTPRAAGVASRVLLEARRRLGHSGGIRIAADGTTIMAEGNGHTISNWQLRRALEEAAYTGYTPADYDPVAAVGDPWPTSTPIVTEAAWLQIGWGDLTADPEKGVVAGALAYLGLGGTAPSKDSGFCDFQTKVMEERILYWGSVALDSGEHQVDGDIPYIFCGSSLPALPAGPSGNPVEAGDAVPVDTVTCTDNAGTVTLDPEDPQVTTSECS